MSPTDGKLNPMVTTPVKFIGVLLLLGGFSLLLIHLVGSHTLPLIHTKGLVATQERNLIVTATLLMLVVVVPVLTLTFTIAWHYRANNVKATYQPDFDHSLLAESIWWGIPCLIIAALAVITWNSTHALDPSKALALTKAPLTIEVVALPWKWLFLYPGQQVASVNEVHFPTGTPVTFKITSDAPMNSFFIPELSGQIYAMSGMTTSLNLVADHDGRYRGQSSNLSGAGFAGMTFTAVSSSNNDFTEWVQAARNNPNIMDGPQYKALQAPSENTPPAIYSLPNPHFYQEILKGYMPAMGK